MTMRQFAASNCTLTWGDVDLTRGLSDGSSLSVAYTAPRYVTKTAGPSGIPTRVKTSDRTVTATVTLDQESYEHKLLRQIAAQDDATADKLYDLRFVNHASGEVITVRQAFIVSQPGETRGTDTTTMAWSFFGSSVNYGGPLDADEV